VPADGGVGGGSKIDWNGLNDAVGNKNFTPGPGFLGKLISDLLPYALTFGGLILFVMIVSGGFTMLSSPTNPQAQESGKQRITYAVVGFIILFAAYWIMQILKIIFKIDVV
jgi:hypothetical protein